MDKIRSCTSLHIINFFFGRMKVKPSSETVTFFTLDDRASSRMPTSCGRADGTFDWYSTSPSSLPASMKESEFRSLLSRTRCRWPSAAGFSPRSRLPALELLPSLCVMTSSSPLPFASPMPVLTPAPPLPPVGPGVSLNKRSHTTASRILEAAGNELKWRLNTSRMLYTIWGCDTSWRDVSFGSSRFTSRGSFVGVKHCPRTERWDESDGLRGRSPKRTAGVFKYFFSFFLVEPAR
mmetsp:Transcript_20298/g.57158  ORF Transcript_20298/g.57158 Transcript_20298/m.57158 type:complete len:236 (-) Transcript_20298:535-1242(-)